MGFSRVPWLHDVILLLREIDTEILEALEKTKHLWAVIQIFRLTTMVTCRYIARS